MSGKPTEIEVEVVEIDGVATVRPERNTDDQTSPRNPWHDWSQWKIRLPKPTGLWWPVWVVLGIVALALILTIGLAAALVFVFVRIITGIMRALTR